MVRAPNPGISNVLDSVAGTGPDDIWAVGAQGTGIERRDGGEGPGAPEDRRPLVLHWDGSEWRLVPVPDVSGRMGSISADAPDDVWAVDTERSNVIFHWDGRQWSASSAALTDGIPPFFDSIAALGPDDMWAVGYSMPNYSRAVAEHWDGHTLERGSESRPGRRGRGPFRPRLRPGAR